MQGISLGLDCPTGLLELVQPLADYDYVLVEKASREPAYLSFFKTSRKPKLLNNRLIGKAESVPLDEIKRVWDVLGGEVIAPDWMGASKKTFDAYDECCKTFGEENVVGVIQGTSQEDIDTCLGLYGSKVALPFDVGSTYEEDIQVKVHKRFVMVGALESKRIHLLGLLDPRELEFYGYPDSVESLNTGFPILLALQGRYVGDYRGDKSRSSHNSMNMSNPKVDNKTYGLIEDNVRYIKRLLGGK